MIQQEVVIIDIAQGFKLDRKPMKAEAVLLHPDNLTIAAKAKAPTGGSVVQVSHQKLFISNFS